MDPAKHRPVIQGLLGASCHSIEALLKAAAAGCDYATLSPVFPPRSKPGDMREALGIEALRQAATALRMPVIALGGMTPERARMCWEAGAHGIASLGLLFGGNMSPEETTRTAQLLRAAMPSG